MNGASASPRLVIRRGQVLLIELDPAVGVEQGKVRPCVVVGNSAANEAVTRSGRGVITVVPVTSNARAVYPFQTLLGIQGTGLLQPSKAQAEQLRSVSMSRVVRQLGWIGTEEMARIDDALRVHLSL